MLALLVAPLAHAGMPKSMQADAGWPGDAGDSFAQARSLPGPGVYSGELTPGVDNADVYAVTVPAGVTFAVSLDSQDGVVVEMIRPGEFTAWTTSWPVYGTLRRIEEVDPVPGVWHLRVRLGGPSVLPYVLNVTLDPDVVTSAAPVVVATFDTGTNPFHPCFRRPGIDVRALVPAIPEDVAPLRLEFLGTYHDSRDASAASLASMANRRLYHVADTNILYRAETGAPSSLVDTYPHGAQASSQIACAEYGLAPNALLVVLNWYAPNANRASLVRWAADQPWIDVLHLNVQDTPLPTARMPEVAYAVAKGKVVVVAAGNGVAGQGASYPSELSRYNGPTGVLIAGANNNRGYTAFSNLNPDVVMDGDGTVAAAPDSFGSTSFGGTSSSSPRVSGYVARILGELRAAHGHTGVGLVTIPAPAPHPVAGPLADGALTAAELHEVVRKTADPDPHESRYDGTTTGWWTPGPQGLPVSVYAKMGYGEVSERTLPHALDVLSGRAPMPERPAEDAHFAASGAFRRAWWG